MPTMICPKCKWETKKIALFCGKCGTKLVPVPEKAICQSCGAELKQNAEFCSQCGTKWKGVPDRNTSACDEQNKNTNADFTKEMPLPLKQYKKRSCWRGVIDFILLILALLGAILGAMAAKHLADKTWDWINPYRNEGPSG